MKHVLLVEKYPTFPSFKEKFEIGDNKTILSPYAKESPMRVSSVYVKLLDLYNVLYTSDFLCTIMILSRWQ